MESYEDVEGPSNITEEEETEGPTTGGATEEEGATDAQEETEYTEGEGEDTEATAGAEETEEQEAQQEPAQRKARPNPLQLLGALRPSRLALTVRSQSKRVQRIVWRLEDMTRFGAKFALKAALKAARPALICLIVARTMRTIDASMDPLIRMAKLPENQQMDFYCSNLMGENWQDQVQQDLLDAMKEVDEGLVTDEIAHEKRQLSAVMLRRMEVEEWDKERMRHFYYGLYGLGPWYWDMEERLHNPFFVGARAWNGPIQSWVGDNKTFPKDLPAGSTDFRELAVQGLNEARGQPLTPEEEQALRKREEMSGLDHLLTSDLFRGVVEPLDVRRQLAQRTAEGQ